MSKKSILVGTATANGNIFTGHNISILHLERLCAAHGIDMANAFTYNEAYPQKSKNSLCATFMQSQHTHLLLIDPDIEFDAEDIIKMLEFDQPVVGGLNYKRKIRWDKLAELANQKGDKNFSIDTLKTISREYNFIPKDDNMQNMNFDEEFNEVDAVGTGVLLLKREALSKIEESYPKDKYVEDGEPFFRFFDSDIKNISAINTKIYIGDDLWFCNRWRQLGGKIYVHTKFRSKHWGVYGY